MKKIQEKITIVILYILALPFLIGFLLLFFLGYVLIFPFEIIPYRNSFYFKELKEKYYLLISITKSYKTFNKFYKAGTKLKLAEFDLVKLGDKYLIKYDESFIKIDLSGTLTITNDILKPLNLLIVLRKDLLSKEQLKNLKTNENILLYNK